MKRRKKALRVALSLNLVSNYHIVQYQQTPHKITLHHCITASLIQPTYPPKADSRCQNRHYVLRCIKQNIIRITNRDSTDFSRRVRGGAVGAPVFRQLSPSAAFPGFAAFDRCVGGHNHNLLIY
jgi:hypothetical protein